MSRVDAAADPTLVLGGLACAALSCLFLTSTVILVLILIRRARRSPADGAAGPDDSR
ncbi:MAG: hypothetical protein IRY85_02040 [Micromonosporaceae bacterium]|nr:hypothetical protein [Micromonosporaceae bacterium]